MASQFLLLMRIKNYFLRKFRERIGIILVILFSTSLSLIAIGWKSAIFGIITGSLSTLAVIYYIVRFTEIIAKAKLIYDEKMTEVEEKQTKDYYEKTVTSLIDVYQDEYFTHHISKEADQVEINWVSKVSDLDMGNDDVFLISKNNTYKENITNIVYRYTERSVIPNGRWLIDNSILGGIDYYVTKDIIDSGFQSNSTLAEIVNKLSGSSEDSDDLTEAVVENIFEKNLTEKSIPRDELNKRRREIKEMRESGLLSTILLGEFSKISAKYESPHDIEDEIRKYYTGVFQASEKEGVPGLLFDGDEINVSIIKVRRDSGFNIQRKYVAKSMNYYNSVYILAIGRSCEMAEQIYDTIIGDEKPQKVNSHRKDDYYLDGKKRWYAEIEMSKNALH